MFLRFVDGKFLGGEFPLKPNREFTIGRGSEHDMVLDEDMVSRSHARLSTFDGEVLLEDLGSTNGTLVNGEPIEQAKLRDGDQITVGNSVLVLRLGKATRTDAIPKPVGKRQVAQTLVHNVRFMDGKIGSSELNFFDLVEDMKTAKVTGVFEVTHGAEGKGKLFIQEGDVIGAHLDLPSKDARVLSGRKAFLRIILWSVGRFKFSSGQLEQKPSEPLNPEDLMIAARQEQEMFDSYQQYLPNPDTNLRLAKPLVAKLSELSPEALDTLQLAMNHGRVRTIVDQGIASDFEIYQDILYLIQNGYVTDS